jgi:hypothetical protein
MENKVDKFAYHIGNKFFCEECLTEEEAKAIKEKEVVTKKDVEKSEEIFCDKCKKKIN